MHGIENRPASALCNGSIIMSEPTIPCARPSDPAEPSPSMQTAQAMLADDGVARGMAQRDRLVQQSRVWEPFTRRILAQAGLRPGQRVLDAGCGAGGAMALMAEIVGPNGRVSGLDIDDGIARPAVQDLQRQGPAVFDYLDVDLETGDWAPEQPLDMVFARRVMFHMGEPLAVLRRLWSWVRPGGTLLLMDTDLTVARSFPQLPVLERGMRLVNDAFRRAGHDIETGARLPAMLLEAGIGPAQASEVFSLITGSLHGAALLRGTLASLAPVILRHGLADAAALARLDAALDAVESQPSTCRWPDLVATWKFKPR